MTNIKVDFPFPHVEYFETLGIKISEANGGKSKLVMPFNQKLTQPYGMIHGGAIFSLADSACAVAIASIIKNQKKFVTAEMKINYLEPVIEDDLISFGKVLREGRVIPVEAEVFNKNNLVAKAIATYIILDN